LLLLIALVLPSLLVRSDVRIRSSRIAMKSSSRRLFP